MKFKLALILCILGFTPVINAMIPRSEATRSGTTYDLNAESAEDKALRLIMDNNVKELEDMLKSGEISISAFGPELLLDAIFSNRLNIVKILIEYGAQVQASDIEFAKAYRFTDIVKVLEEAQKAQEEIR